jgi:diketogulonate reductase-like aldo/keto reductase
VQVVTANGCAIPALGFGTWQLAGRTAQRMVEAALTLGYRHVDTAEMYGNEAEVGAAIRASRLPRDAVFVATKIWPEHFRAGDLERAAAASLRRLALDEVDLLLLHWPNPAVPLAGTIGALNRVRATGRARHIGVSNFPGALLDEAVRLSPAPLAALQVEYHPFLSQRRVLERCRAHGLALVAYCPLARGRVFHDPVLGRIAARHERSAGQVALRWLIQQPGVAAIPRSSSEAHARANLATLDLTLSTAEMAEIHGLARPDGRICDFPGLSPEWDRE